MIQSITVIGLGNMGRGMALTLHRAGFEVQGTDIAEPARQRLEADGIATAPMESLAATDAYLLSLPTSAQVREVLESRPGLLNRAPAGSLIVDTSTSDPAESRELAARVVDAGLAWLDAPVSGGPSGAHSGQLGMLIGGQPDTLERARPLLEALAARITHVGDAGSGHVVKLANNFLCAAHLLTTAEAVAMASRAGVDPEACLQGLNSGSGRSAVSEVNFPRWVLSGAFDSGFTTGLMRKDLRLARQAAEGLGMPEGLMRAVVDAWHDDEPALDDSDDFNRIVQRMLSTDELGARNREEETRS
ncbi:NAD(P)-dependent oxidoreductase [Billgrantia gudaonensis]|uniref:3-hydroxyisobutyrate dehydrogenase n=1 Tax=Billgrantia gudaonensis TaxID=376427 RepID=A0A1G8QWE8_9GAMM|nr:NAD(P)-dependent oxidoreductase [Halomonas gudaonensis]SDJ08943.1 3-hydroxyisobutyrate dehydrogenase [Halomonas gudaonensis]